jgi:hypothetical protein
MLIGADRRSAKNLVEHNFDIGMDFDTKVAANTYSH